MDIARDGAGLEPADWEEFRALGHRAVDDAVAWWRGLRAAPVWTPVAEAARARLARPAPRAPRPAADVYEDWLAHVRPFGYGAPHPRFWGWVNGSGVPIGALADFLASVLNANLGAFQQAPVLVERQVLGWFAELFSFPDGAGGILTSGASMANLLALAAARNARAGFDVRREGLRAAPRPLAVYASSETHASVEKGLELLGLGANALRRIAVDDAYRVDVAALAHSVADDRAAGLRPIAVIGNAGTVNTGATDDLAALAELCEREGLWFHVDGAFGALAALCPELRPPLAGLERADSLAFDLHKWLFLSNDVGALLVRDKRALTRTFGAADPASYLSALRGGPHSDPETYMDAGPELTRRFRALKVWMAIENHGLDRFAATIRENVAQIRHLVGRIEAAPELELLAPAPLNVACFRWRGAHLDEEDLNALNKELLVRLQERGLAVPSHTVLHGRFALRVAVTNHRTRREDFDFLADEVTRLGDELARELAGGGEPAWRARRRSAAFRDQAIENR